MSKEVWILEMTPSKPVPLAEWLGLALTRFALGGVTIGEVVESWMTRPPESPTPTVDVNRVAQMMAHRVCISAEHDVMNGKMHGCCVVCAEAWPCSYAGPTP